MENNVITIAFAEDAKAYQALSDLKRAAVAGQLEVTAAAIVQRNADGQFSLKDGVTDGSASGHRSHYNTVGQRNRTNLQRFK